VSICGIASVTSWFWKVNLGVLVSVCSGASCCIDERERERERERAGKVSGIDTDYVGLNN
jgi:hypothetical protein